MLLQRTVTVVTFHEENASSNKELKMAGKFTVRCSSLCSFSQHFLTYLQVGCNFSKEAGSLIQCNSQKLLHNHLLLKLINITLANYYIAVSGN